MRCIGRFIVMDRPQPAVADAALSAHRPQPGAVSAAQGPVCIPGIAGRSFLHRHPRWLFSRATPPAHRRKRKRKGCVSFSGLAGRMAQAEGLAPSSCGFGDRCFALSYAYKKCPASQPGWGLIHSHAADTPRRPHAAKRNHNGQLRICPPQHKSRKAVSRSLRLLTVSLYHFYRGLSRVNSFDFPAPAFPSRVPKH